MPGLPTTRKLVIPYSVITEIFKVKIGIGIGIGIEQQWDLVTKDWMFSGERKLKLDRIVAMLTRFLINL